VGTFLRHSVEITESHQLESEMWIHRAPLQ